MGRMCSSFIVYVLMQHDFAQMATRDGSGYAF